MGMHIVYERYGDKSKSKMSTFVFRPWGNSGGQLVDARAKCGHLLFHFLVKLIPEERVLLYFVGDYVRRRIRHVEFVPVWRFSEVQNPRGTHPGRNKTAQLSGTAPVGGPLREAETRK